VKPAEALRARHEGLDPARYRPLRFDAPLLSDDNRARIYRLVGGPVDSEMWFNRMAHLLAHDLRGASRGARDARAHARSGVEWVRLGWLAHCCERVDFARYCLAKAEADLIRASHAVVGHVAGQSWIAETVRRRKGREAHGAAPMFTAELVRAAIEANPDASNRRIAQLTGVNEKTIRRLR
jgi:hypothetical protein